jgi:hypothetical protein
MWSDIESLCVKTSKITITAFRNGRARKPTAPSQGLDQYESYFFVVRAFDHNGNESDDSNEVYLPANYDDNPVDPGTEGGGTGGGVIDGGASVGAAAGDGSGGGGGGCFISSFFGRHRF